MRPRLLDLFSGAGGTGMGYHRAGFDVLGVDIAPQPHYPFPFVQADALEFLASADLSAFAAVHASPPCQDHIRGGLQNTHGTGWLLAATREKLSLSGLPWVIENVPGAPMRADFVLCGSQFGLAVRRHRWFETSPQLFDLLAPCDHTRPIAGVYGHPHGKAGAWPGMLPSTLGTWQAAMGIDWMDSRELGDAIPPAYTEFIGGQLLASLAEAAA